MRLPDGPNVTPTPLFNPTKEDFSCTYANDQNIPITYTLPSRQIITFPKYLADHIVKHLAQKIASADDENGLAYDTRYTNAVAKILITL